MSKIALSGDASGTGTFTIASPNSNSNFTLSLPTESGTLTTTASTPTFTGAVTAPAFIPNSSTVPTNGVFLPAANTVGFSTNSTERMRLDASGRLGIGTSSPAKPVNIVTAATTEVWVESTSTEKAILNINAGDLSVGLTSTYNSGGTAARPFAFKNVSTDLITFDLNKTVALQGATSQSGTGITFPATQSASSDANTLDDYEEGTWTPSLGGNTTYNTQSGTYTKIGRQVTVRGQVNVNTIGTGSTTTISGLPFTTAGNFHGTGYWGLAANNLVYLVLQTVSSDTTIQIYDATAATDTLGTTAVFKNSTNVTFTITYFV